MKKTLISLMLVLFTTSNVMAHHATDHNFSEGAHSQVDQNVHSTSEVRSTAESSSNNVNTNTSTSESTNNNNNTTTNKTHSKIDTNDVKSAIAPNISSNSPDVCSLPVSGAVQSSIIGISGGTTFTDENCERLKLAKILYDIGLKTSAVSLLCQDDRVWEAMLHAGTLCPVYGLTGKAALKYYFDNIKKYKNHKKDILELYDVKFSSQHFVK